MCQSKMFRSVLLFVAVLFCISGANAADRYVAVTGADANNTCSNQNSPCKTIQHAISVSHDAETIHAAAGEYAEHILFNNHRLKTLTLSGAGTATTSLNGSFNGRVVKVIADLNVTITDLSILSGSATKGAGVLNLGTLTLKKVKVDGNQAGADGGGGIDNEGTLTLSNCTIQANAAAGNGGGILNNKKITIVHSLFYANLAIYGGGFYNAGHGIAGLANVVFKQNSANFDGGGLFNEVHAGVVMKVGLFRQNSTTQGCCGGGGFFNDGTANVTNVTFFDNSGEGGGGVFNDGHIALTNTTFSGNSTAGGTGSDIHSNPTTGAVTVKNTIVNSTGGACSGPITDGGFNLDAANSCGFTSAQHDLTNSNPQLQTLASNGGFCGSMALPANSPAIDAADNASCPAIDQRFTARPQDGNNDGNPVCDIGAFEYKP